MCSPPGGLAKLGKERTVLPRRCIHIREAVVSDPFENFAGGFASAANAPLLWSESVPMITFFRSK